jgi:hypothetical protein
MRIPHFENESEEASWWFANRDTLTEEFERAAREGRLKRESPLLERIRARSIVLPLSSHERTALHTLAQRRGMEDEKYALELLQRALGDELDKEQ